MRRQFLCWLVAFLLFSPVLSLAQTGGPAIDGYVTNAGSAESFELNGRTVLCDANTVTQRIAKGVKSDIQGCFQHIYGERLAIFGKHPSKTQPLVAEYIRAFADFEGRAVEGLALIDLIVAPDLFRADGLAFHTNPQTEVSWDVPLNPTEGFQIQEWVEYRGTIDEHGVVEASWIFISAPDVSPGEEKLRKKNEFDPSAVKKEDQQDPIAKFLVGTDYRRIPALKDPEFQRRIDEIGRRLVPAYQSKLSPDDPNKINFRFQLVDKKWKQCVGLPSGVILVPAHMVHKLKDDELAPVLAYSMAAILEKQDYRHEPVARKLHALEYGGAAAGLFVPGFGLAAQIGAGLSGYKTEQGYEQQRDRMSLVLLHDGGFDIEQAPLSWWRLETKDEDFMRVDLPSRSAYLFEAIADFWNPASPLISSQSRSEATSNR